MRLNSSEDIAIMSPCRQYAAIGIQEQHFFINVWPLSSHYSISIRQPSSYRRRFHVGFYKWMRTDATNTQSRFEQSLFSTLVANPPTLGWFLSQTLYLGNSMQSYYYRIVGITHTNKFVRLHLKLKSLVPHVYNRIILLVPFIQ
jgi:hypothetical protein